MIEIAIAIIVVKSPNETIPLFRKFQFIFKNQLPLIYKHF